ncbi:ATP-dependent Clp protease ATP-binding subunit [Patescibacteria group bacterium]|nr:ATP-dependent Clp protease ATP-binding subunit [Patescibacteria group bacterium]MBU1721406.1 ATP-dependent Clp protease ATP-binding subunit [Patescibacteria group bacterium]
MEDKQTILPSISVCAVCQGKGTETWGTCRECHGIHTWYSARGTVYFFGNVLSTYHVRYRQWKRILRQFELIGALIFSIMFLGFFAHRVYRYDLFSLIGTDAFWQINPYYVQTFFFAGLISLCFLVYRIWNMHTPVKTVESLSYLAKKEEEYIFLSEEQLKKAKKIDVTKIYADEVWRVVEKGYMQARNSGTSLVLPEHIFIALLDTITVQNMCLRLGVAPSSVRLKTLLLLEKKTKVSDPVLSEVVAQALLGAYEYARIHGDDHIYITSLLQAIVASSYAIQQVLYDVAIDQHKLEQVVGWVRIREQLRRQYKAFSSAAGHTSKKGMDRAMTAIATPFLNNFSIDLTTAAVRGHIAVCVGRDKELDEIFRLVDSGSPGVLLVGEHGVGKMSIIEGMVSRIIKGDVPKFLEEKRVVQVSSSALLAGTTVSGAQERLLRMMAEVRRARNIVLFINNIHDLMEGAGDKEGLDVSETLAEYMGNGQVMVFATTTPQGHSTYVANSQLAQSMQVITIKEMEKEQAIAALEGHIGGIEYHHHVYFSYDALESAVVLAKHFLHDTPLPKSAISLAKEVATFVARSSGKKHLIQKEDIASIVHEKTGVPITSITEDESGKLLSLEKEMHERVIGQNMAVEQVANALRRARAGVRETNRPIASFLFMGPTGVGKTELAKTMAEVYFGGEAQMLRFDMSEFQTPESMYRLIGEPGKQGSGLLTEAIRKKPFSLLLLDEFEKANPSIYDLFLQVFDDGRLTDGIGRVIDFTNTIIIATSNAGTKVLQEHIRQGDDMEQIADDMKRHVLQEYFRPELLNRFDGIIAFTPLSRKEVEQIAVLMLRRIEKELDVRGIGFTVNEEGLAVLAEAGYDPEFGARPMRRAIQDIIENPLATLLVSGAIGRKDHLVFDGRTLRKE